MLSIAVALLGWAVLIEPGQVVAREVRVPIARWPEGLGPVRIAAIADVHAGAPHMTLDALRGIVVTVNAAHPDLIVLLGDYVIHGIIGGRFIEPEPIATVLGRLSAPLGVLAVTGNHDWWYDGKRVTAALEAAGIQVLEDVAVPVPIHGRPVWIAGVGDTWTRRADISRALDAVPAGDPVIVVTHNPDIFPSVPGRVLLTLAGHTHGGQVDLPLLGRLVVPSRYGPRYAIGHVREDGRDLFVTPGLGTSILPVRFRVPPEISLLTVGR
jgi:predicted MPP superfamily phosphohydrolase